MRLNKNMHSLSLYNSYKRNLIKNSSSLEKISTGNKINSAKDNPNKLGQSENMRIQIKSLQAAQKNLQDSTSMVQATDGALQEVNNVLSRMKELAISAADGTKSNEDKITIQNEIDQMKAAIDDLAMNTEFNGERLIGNSNIVSNKYPDYKELTSGAMVGDQLRIPIFNLTTELLKDNDGNSIRDLDVVNNVDIGLNTINESITEVSKIRSKYGAIQSRLESSQENLEGTIITITRAESNLRDTDVALEMAELVKSQLLNDSAIALMKQSNQLPQDALRVLERIK